MAKAVGFFFLFVGILVVCLGLGSLLAYPVKWLVNWLFTPAVLMAVFGTPQLGFWQAWGLSTLCGFLFKGVSTSTTTTK